MAHGGQQQPLDLDYDDDDDDGGGDSGHLLNDEKEHLFSLRMEKTRHSGSSSQLENAPLLDDGHVGGAYAYGTLSSQRTPVAKVLWECLKRSLCCVHTIKDTQRTVEVDPRAHVALCGPGPFPANVVRNQKYSLLSFFPMFLYEQFKYFFNLYFLVVALTQFLPVLQVGFLFTYVAPLVFVLAITMCKEAVEDFKRWRRDTEANSQTYERLRADGSFEVIPSSSIRVGDMIRLHTNQRVPADMVLLRAAAKDDDEDPGAIFIRTDQLDGETDWKLRRAVQLSQRFPSDDLLLHTHTRLIAEAPRREIYGFLGTYSLFGGVGGGDVEQGSATAAVQTEGLSLENTLWSNTVVASGTVIGCVVYTGTETRTVLNASTPRQKVGKLDLELNELSKILFVMTTGLAFVLIFLKGFNGAWYIYFFRFVLLLSAIIPISLRVNLDLGKMLYSLLIMRDDKIQGTVVRTS